jgi:hypothetical protein
MDGAGFTSVAAAPTLLDGLQRERERERERARAKRRCVILPNLGEKVGPWGDDANEGLYIVGHFERLHMWRTKTMRLLLISVSGLLGAVFLYVRLKD